MEISDTHHGHNANRQQTQMYIQWKNSAPTITVKK